VVTDNVRVGFIGTGFIAELHATMLTPVPGCRIGPVFDLDADRASRFASAQGGRSVPSAEAVVVDCDAVMVCTWTSAHHDAVALAVEQDRPVLCEKPLAVDLAGARDLADLVRDAGVINQVGLVMRRAPAFRWLRHQLRLPANGRPMNLVFRDDQCLPVGGQYRSDWRADRARAGGGALLEHSIHDLDLLEWLIGPLTSVQAIIGERPGLPGIDDQVTVTVMNDAGVQAALVSVWHDIDRRPSGRRVEAFCADALLTIDGEWFGPVSREADTEQVTLEGAELDGLVRGIDGDIGNPDAAFVDAVRSGRPATPDVDEALRAHELVDAAYRSAADGGAPISV